MTSLLLGILGLCALEVIVSDQNLTGASSNLAKLAASATNRLISPAVPAIGSAGSTSGSATTTSTTTSTKPLQLD